MFFFSNFSLVFLVVCFNVVIIMCTCAGNEGNGVHREVEKECEAILTVSSHAHLPPGMDSLNVAVAAGILLHAIQRTSENNYKQNHMMEC